MTEEQELGLKGKGAEIVRIEALDKLVEKYISLRDKRAELSRRESEAKAALIDGMHEHSEQLSRPDGSLVYSFDETTVSLIIGDEKLKIETSFNDN